MDIFKTFLIVVMVYLLGVILYWVYKAYKAWSYEPTVEYEQYKSQILQQDGWRMVVEQNGNEYVCNAFVPSVGIYERRHFPKKNPMRAFIKKVFWGTLIVAILIAMVLYSYAPG